MKMNTCRRNTCDFEGEEIKCRFWSDLPTDVLNIMIGRLLLVDQIRFRAVCKSWRLAEIHSAQKLPWLVAHHWSYANNGDVLSACEFHIPYHNQSYVTVNKIEEEEPYNLYGGSICASKNGWLLMQKGHKPFFYNPFSKNIIELPAMKIGFNRATFSSAPTSRECVCFAIQSSKTSKEIRITTCCLGDHTWFTLTLDGFHKAIEDVIYINRKFYCVFRGGALGAFDVATRGWSLLTDLEPLPAVQSWYRAQMVESNGELLLVSRSNTFNVFAFDWQDKFWVAKERLEDRALFLACTSFSVSLEDELSILADRIYYHVDMLTCFYCLRTRKNYRCFDFYPWTTERLQEKCWIQPLQYF